MRCPKVGRQIGYITFTLCPSLTRAFERKKVDNTPPLGLMKGNIIVILISLSVNIPLVEFKRSCETLSTADAPLGTFDETRTRERGLLLHEPAVNPHPLPAELYARISHQNHPPATRSVPVNPFPRMPQ